MARDSARDGRGTPAMGMEEVAMDAVFARRSNQSRQHQDLANRSLGWLSRRASMRGVRGTTEVTLPHLAGVQVDALALCGLQRRFHPQYALGTDYKYEALVCVFEVKVSRDDFHRSFR